MAIANVILFLGLGMMSIAKGYDKYIEQHMVWLQLKINKLKGEEENELFERIDGTNGERFRSSNRSRTNQVVSINQREIAEDRIGTTRVFESTQSIER